MSFAVWLIARTPLPLAAAFSWLVSWLWWTVVPVRRSLALANFRAALPGLVPGPPLRQMMRGILLGYFELFRELHRPGTISLAIEAAEEIVERARIGKATLLLATHLGSYDLVGGLLATRTGVPSTVVVKIPRAPALAKLLEKVRTGYHLEILPNKPGAMAAIYDLASRGQLIGFFLDQRLTRGIPVPFFGRPALTAPALAVAAAKTGGDVFFLEYWREGVGRHGCRFVGPLPLTGRIEEDTAAFTRRIEEAIRRRPHSWLWLHDRWKGAPEAGAPHDGASGNRIRPEGIQMSEPAEVEEIAGQILIAFGQGTGMIRIPRVTVRTMRAYFSRFAGKAVPRWAADGTEVLERVRLMGRLAAQLAVGRGSLELSIDDFTKAAESVRMASQTDICN